MKHITLTSLILSALFFNSFAQSVSFGIAAGASIANYQMKYENLKINGDSKAGISAGIVAELPMGQKLSLQPALNFVQKGFKLSENYGTIEEKQVLAINALEMPVNILYNIYGNTGTFFIGGGPSVTYAVSGKYKYEEDGVESYSEKIKFGNNPDEDNMKPFEFGVNALAGYRLPNGLFISAGYNKGLSNLTPGGSEDGTMKSSYYNVKIGFMLNSRRGDY